MKPVKDKYLLMAADFAGYPLKEAIKESLEKKGWRITDIGVKADSDPNDTELMFHRIGLRVGSMITERNIKRGGFTVCRREGFSVGQADRSNLQNARFGKVGKDGRRQNSKRRS